jgi:hypothetical protein
LQKLKVEDLNVWDMWTEWKRIQWSKEILKDTPVEEERLLGLRSDGWMILRKILD